MSLPQTLLASLISLPSVNPMGGEPDSNCFESRVTDFLQSRCERLAIPFRREPVEAGRDNFVAWLPGPSEDSPLVIWEAHQDTVPVAGMTIPPFEPEVRAGRMYGRGACDVKGPLAAMLAAFEKLAASGTNDVGIALACSVNEEFGASGAAELAGLWEGGQTFPFDRQPAAVIVAEPTGLNAVSAHKGTVRWTIRASGVAAHSSTPALGENAIYRMATAVRELEYYANDVVPALREHSRLGRPSLSVGLIQGGSSVNIVPDACSIEIDRRLIPGEAPEEAWRHAAAFLEQRGCQVVCEPPYLGSHPLTDDCNSHVVAKLAEASRCNGRVCENQTAAYCSDASRFSHWPTVVFGPGDIAQAHTCDEWIDLDELALAEAIFLTLGGKWTEL